MANCKPKFVDYMNLETFEAVAIGLVGTMSIVAGVLMGMTVA